MGLVFVLIYFAILSLFYVAVPIAIFISGFKFGAKLQHPTRLKLGLAALLIPPIALVALYFAFSSTGCSGGDCAGPMIGLGFLLIPFAAIAIFGLGVLIQAAWSAAVTSAE